MKKRDIILVLEDSEDRILWLRKVVEPMGYGVDWWSDVALFLHATEAQKERLALLVFDHDLGHAAPQRSDTTFDAHMLIKFDSAGLCGLDAAKRLGNHACPAVSWSWNKDGRMAIAHELHRERKVGKILSAPFTASEDYAIQIRRLLG